MVPRDDRQPVPGQLHRFQQVVQESLDLLGFAGQTPLRQVAGNDDQIRPQPPPVSQFGVSQFGEVGVQPGEQPVCGTVGLGQAGHVAMGTTELKIRQVQHRQFGGRGIPTLRTSVRCPAGRVPG
jgi:hypothetical protein